MTHKWIIIGNRPTAWPEGWTFPGNAYPPGWPRKMPGVEDLTLSATLSGGILNVKVIDRYGEVTEVMDGEMITAQALDESMRPVRVRQDGSWGEGAMISISDGVAEASLEFERPDVNVAIALFGVDPRPSTIVER